MVALRAGGARCSTWRAVGCRWRRLVVCFSRVRVQLDVADEARDLLATLGYDPAMGARPMARVIQEKLKKPLAEMILFGDLSESGGIVHVTVDNGELHLETEAEMA